MAVNNYADQFVDWLVEDGYTHCFFLAGGNIMHLLNSARTRFTCVPVINEVAAGIAVEYFNALREPSSGRAFALVTAGPGVTNILTAMAGAFLESREMLVVAGQVKSTDLAAGGLRQRGIQEVDGCSLTTPVTKSTLRILTPIGRGQINHIIKLGERDRKGPVFLEFCLDAQAGQPVRETSTLSSVKPTCSQIHDEVLAKIGELLSLAKRPVLLLGGGVSRPLMQRSLADLEAFGMPVMTTWNALDRIDYYHPLFLGRPDTWGMRAANVTIQQADLLIAVGARLSLQQTGFAWEDFLPLGAVVHVDLDELELAKPHPRKDISLCADAEEFLSWLFAQDPNPKWDEWREFGKGILAQVPLDDSQNVTGDGFISPYKFSSLLSDELGVSDILVPCSSGGASTVLMQSFRQKYGQKVINNKALASMGYGLSGAIGAALANPDWRVILVEGDGGFAQNLQELGTVAMQKLNLKIFLFCNDGYASIRMTQRNYFEGDWIGCDASTGVGLPDWSLLAQSYGIRYVAFSGDTGFTAADVEDVMAEHGPALITIMVDPSQTYFPKITSRITVDGSMRSNPLHRMTPELNQEQNDRLMPYLLGETDEQD